MADKVFFSTWPGGVADQYGASGMEMGCSDGRVYFEYVDFDSEDQRKYTYGCSYSIDRHRQALAELQQTGQAVILDTEHHEEMFVISLHGKYVEVFYCGCGGSTGGGTSVHSNVRHRCRLSDLELDG